MEKVTFIESIIKILNLIASVPFFIEIFLLTIIMLIAMLFFYFRKSKKGKVTSLIIYIVTLLLLPISHFSFFAQTLDKIVENYIKILYFPSCYVYIALLIITDISVLRNVIKNLKTQERKWYNSLDLLYFFIFQFFFFLIIRVIITENINIFERSELYSDVSLASLLQISSYLFWIRIGIKLIALIVNTLSKDSPVEKLKQKQPNQNITKQEITKTQDISNESLIFHTVNNERKEPIINSFTSTTNSIMPNSNDVVERKEMPSLQNFPIDKEKESGEKVSNDKFIMNNMASSNFITSIDNNKHKDIKTKNDDLMYFKDNDKKEQREVSVPGVKLVEETQNNKINSNVEIDLKEEETDNFFDDFYE